MKTRGILAALAAVFFFFSCQDGSGKDPGFARISGGVLSVEFARTDEQRAMGLMFRESLATNAGMVFVFDPPSSPAFYMKNTKVALDILFVDATMTVVDIQQMDPFDEKNLHRPPSAVKYAVEANKGWSARYGVKAGDRLSFMEKDHPTDGRR